MTSVEVPDQLVDNPHSAQRLGLDNARPLVADHPKLVLEELDSQNHKLVVAMAQRDALPVVTEPVELVLGNAEPVVADRIVGLGLDSRPARPLVVALRLVLMKLEQHLRPVGECG